MTDLLTRRAVVAGMGVLGLGLLAGCNPARGLEFKYGKNMSNEILGRKFKLKDTRGNDCTLSSFYGSMPMIFFGFTQCPAVCPTALARVVQIKKMLRGRDQEIFQPVFITLDPERDTPEVLDAYVKAFDSSIIALTGTPEEIAEVAREFKVFYEKVPAGDTYTISHSSTSYVYDTRGTLRLSLGHSLNAKECAEDLATLMEIC
ncbi:SCO family protein [Pseudomonas sp. GD03858]|uniref:SCO family protein n=1 Tax=unclassified Pseudomonas TaxID=196821 RepID=UPI00244A8B1C|nr:MULTISPECIES: SCO family protein [unclassified Pseudomonas]MDH0650122.1 SCO family protein [Pseudomonas sp. GD03867]MDH0665147.1 SCO family protein [Pseudomonas sp. GD03858]